MNTEGKKVEILNIGNELLRGNTANTNGCWLAKQLFMRGILPRRILVLPDDQRVLATEIRSAVSRDVELLVISGGLGPTDDDITLRSLSVAIRQPLILNMEAHDQVAAAYKRFYEQKAVDSPDMTTNRAKMAYLPQGAIVIPNSVGSAPGVLLKHEQMWILVCPGVPQEMKSVFSEGLKQVPDDFFPGTCFIETTIKSGCKDESILADAIKRTLRKYPDITIKSLPAGFAPQADLEVYVSLFAASEGAAQSRLHEVIETLRVYIKEL